MTPADREGDAFELSPAYRAIIEEGIPHNAELGLTIEGVGADWAVMRLPWAERLVGDPRTRVLHGGVVTTLLDATCGVAVYMKLQQAVRIATMDLRIDYLRPAEPGRDVFAKVQCYHLTRNVAFLRGTAYHEPDGAPIAAATSTFAVLRDDPRTTQPVEVMP